MSGSNAAPKDVMEALAAMRTRLAANRTAEEPAPRPVAAPAASMTPEAAAAAIPFAPVSPGEAKPPEVWTYKVGKSVFREGEMTYELFMLMEGAVDIYVGGDKVATLDAETHAGTYLGEIGALLRVPRTATVKAVKPCKFLVFPDARRLFAEDPEFGFKLAGILADRIVQSNERQEKVMRALHKAKIKEEVMEAVKGALMGKESTYIGKKSWLPWT